mgnify:CR=1 FL=1
MKSSTTAGPGRSRSLQQAAWSRRIAAARRAGATEILEGEIAGGDAGLFRLDLRRLDLKTGVVRRGYLVQAVDRHALVDSVTSLVAADLRVAGPVGSVASVTTGSPIAYRLYERGLRTYFHDVYAARGLFEAAVREDSNFAMAAYYSWLTAAETDQGHVDRARHALRVAEHASDRDRLLIQTHIARSYDDPAGLVIAESLATRFGSDPEALTRAAGTMAHADMGTSRPILLLERAIAIDSATGSGQTGSCRLCRALGQLASIYAWRDSADAAERTLRRWTQLAPSDPGGWEGLAERIFRWGDEAEAVRTLARAPISSKGRGDPTLGAIVRAMHRDEWEAARQLCATGFATAVDETWGRYRWYCAIVLRSTGRYRDALRLVREGQVPDGAAIRPNTEVDAVSAAILDFEMGRPGLAAIAFNRLADEFAANNELLPGSRARGLTWNRALAATAMVTAGDTVGARELVDSVERSGRRSLYERDQKLHHFIRGQLLAVAGRHDSALAEYRMAVNSWPFGFTRINYELAASAIAAGRPTEAIYPLQAALRGGIEGPQLYLTRTELHERLAEAFAATGQPDSAAAHYRIVVSAWKAADPILQPRLAAARAWLARRR